MRTISPRLFLDSPALRTDIVSSPAISTADLVFSAEERYLAVHADECSLHLWDMLDRRWIPTADGYTKRVVWSSDLDGFLGIVDGSVRSFTCEGESCKDQTIVSELPEIGLEEWSDLIWASGQLVVCTPRWVRSYDGRSGELRSHWDVLPSPGFQIRRVGVGASNGSPSITILSLSKDHARFEAVDPVGRVLSSFDFLRPRGGFRGCTRALASLPGCQSPKGTPFN